MADSRPAMVKKAVLFLTFLTHLIACNLFAKGLAKYLFWLYQRRVSFEYTDWTGPWVYRGKPMELMWFTLAFSFLYLCIFGWAFVYRKVLSAGEDRGEPAQIAVLLLNAACVGGIGLVANRTQVRGGGVAIATVLLVIMAVTVALRASGRVGRLSVSLPSTKRLEALLPMSGRLLTALFVVAVVLLSYDLVGLVFGNQLVLRNEFVEVSEKTLIDGKAIDNHEFIKNRLGHDQFDSVDDFLSAEHSQVTSDPRYQAAWKAFEAGQDATTSKFIELNSDEFRWQLMNRSFDLHNDQTMNPLNAWMLGVPLRDTHNLYGLGIPTLSRIYFSIVAFSYGNWLRLAFFLEWFYYLSIPLGIYLYTRSRELSFAVFLTVTGTAFYGMYLGYFYLVTCQIPMNPIRHGLDFLAIIALGNVVTRKDALSVALLGATCILAILLGDHFGIATTAASAMTLFVLFLSERRPKGVLLVALMTLVALASFKYSNLTHNPAVAYFLDGYFAWPARDAIINLLVLYSAIYLGLLYLHVRGTVTRDWYLVLFLTLYSNIVAFHYVWHGQKADFVALTILAILVPCVVKLALDSFRLERYRATALLAISLAAFPSSYVGFRASKAQYDREVQGHEVHAWNLPTAGFKTTMPPEDLDNAIDLIKRYSGADDGIYMISKYDYMLPVLARKYSRMEYPNLPYFLVTSREVADVKRQLETERPKLLFVDSDVMLDGQLWTVNNFMTLSDPGFFYENRLRLSRLNELKKIFVEIRDEYRLVEKGRLIDVYERRERS